MRTKIFFTKKEVAKLLGVKHSLIIWLTRAKRGKRPFFVPSIPAPTNGKNALFSKSDVEIIKRYCIARKELDLAIKGLWESRDRERFLDG